MLFITEVYYLISLLQGLDGHKITLAYKVSLV